MTLDEMNKIAELVAEKIKKEQVLLSLKDIAAMFGYENSESLVVRKLVCSPSFPAPINLNAGGHKRWLKSQVLEYLNSLASDTSKTLLMAARSR